MCRLAAYAPSGCVRLNVFGGGTRSVCNTRCYSRRTRPADISPPTVFLLMRVYSTRASRCAATLQGGWRACVAFVPCACISFVSCFRCVLAYITALYPVNFLSARESKHEANGNGITCLFGTSSRACPSKPHRSGEGGYLQDRGAPEQTERSGATSNFTEVLQQVIDVELDL